MMEAITLITTPDKFVISIDKKVLNEDYVLNLVERLRVEYLAESVSFDEQIEEIGKAIKNDWWTKNKERLLGSDK